VIAAVVALLVVVAVTSVVAAYRSGSAAWTREYGLDGFGLTVEMAYLVLTALATLAIAAIMHDSFRELFLKGGWRSPIFVIAALVVVGGASIYLLGVAPSILARKQRVPAEQVRRECFRPYALYAPFALVTWAGLVLPVLAMVTVSIHADLRLMDRTRTELAARGDAAVAMAATAMETPEAHSALYSIEHRSAADVVTRMVSRYLWVVGVFITFVIVLLNTRITSVFTEESQDVFKWLMWGLLAVAIGVSSYGLSQSEVLRSIAIAGQERLLALAERTGELGLITASKAALMDLREEGPIHFLRRTLEGGSVWLLFFNYAFTIISAKVTHRSVVRVIFPTPVARFLDAFVLPSGERQA
jgi:hypothetical protein